MNISVHQLIDKLEKATSEPRKKGLLFQRFVKAYLKLHPYYRSLFSDVWMWNEYPGADNKQDTGIDLVAKEKETDNLWAIQAKYFTNEVMYSDIATFLATSSQKIFKHRLIITSAPLSKTAEENLKKQEKPVTVILLSDILKDQIDWNRFDWNEPEEIYFLPPKTLRPYQQQAVETVIKGFEEADRGKLIMPPGSGKTFVALKIAERLIGKGGYVLFLAPSIALVEQTLRAWLNDSGIPLRVYAVTSDYTVGQDRDSIERTTILTIPPTTEADKLAESASKRDDEKMTVIVSTYHSIDVVSEAQKMGLPEFDLIIADEAHRTTGVMQGEEYSYYLKVHDNEIVRGRRRLYMTATPRVFTPAVKKKLAEMEFECYSMDDEEKFGKEFFRYGFGQAVDEGALSDYKVIVFAVSEREIQSKMTEFLNRADAPSVVETARIVGVWNAINGRVESWDPAEDQAALMNIPVLKRVVVFTGSIKESKAFTENFERTAREYHKVLQKHSDYTDGFRKVEVKHIDGSMPATVRKELLDWLREDFSAEETRVLSNAKVLTEGIDVPALDAVVFLKPRKSVVDVVQAVGRVTRKAEGKRYGYIILPVIVDPTRDIETQINQDDEFRKVWEVLGALRSIDDRFDAKVRQVIIRAQTKRGSSGGTKDERDDVIIIRPPEQLEFDTAKLFEVIRAKLVRQVGSRMYLERWAEDVSKIAERINVHIEELLRNEGELGHIVRSKFEEFVNSLRSVINPSVQEEDAKAMLVQHIITKPIFDALFGEYEFLRDNPVAKSFDNIVSIFQQFVERETSTLQEFYRLIQTRARGINRETERQDFLRQLYDEFFKLAFPKVAESLGIVYTPVEVVDFIVNSAEAVLQDEFGLSLADRGVVILEPFAGTGTFLVRLMQSLPKDALVRKYEEDEIWGNEILLLPYYVALANVESTYHDIVGEYRPFRNLLLVDTFQLMEDRDNVQISLFPEQYTGLMKKQREARINVIISNPPWFAFQENENRGIVRTRYEKLDERIRTTYATYSSAHNKNSLYDSYIRAIRMASDRIEDKGVIAFVLNSGFLDGSAMDGLRKCLAEEFAKIYVLNLRGNARLSGEERRKEGGGIFGEGSRAGVALLILVKDASKKGTAEIYYHDIGDYLTREQKLARLREFKDIRSVAWQRIIPNKYHDWINQRDENYEKMPLIGDKTSSHENTIFRKYSTGVGTSRDVWVYNFSQQELEKNMKRMIEEFNKHVELARKKEITRENLEKTINNDPTKISWSSSLKPAIFKGETYTFENAGMVREAMYRPYVKMELYFSEVFNHRTSLQPSIFPEPDLENIAIAVQAPGEKREFSALITKWISDLHLVGSTQIFPLYTYEPLTNQELGETIVKSKSGKQYIRRLNITEWALNEYRTRYGQEVSAEDIFYYVYGILHSPEYRERYSTELKKMLPRIPFVKTKEDFFRFSEAGHKLAYLHLNYETVEPWDLEEVIIGNPSDPETYKLTKMGFAKTPDGNEDRTTIIYNENITLKGIPLKAYDYVVNGKSAIEWVMERYQYTVDKESGIVNDPNKWLEEHNNSRYILDLLKRIVRVSIETLKIIESLTPLDISE